MTNKPQLKLTAKLEARISPETKALLQKAADLEGRSLTDFVVSSVQAEAYRVIQKHQILKLNVSTYAKIFTYNSNVNYIIK